MESGMFSYPFVVFLHHFQMCEHEKYIIPSPTLSKKANSCLCPILLSWVLYLCILVVLYKYGIYKYTCSFFKPSWLFKLQTST